MPDIVDHNNQGVYNGGYVVSLIMVYNSQRLVYVHKLIYHDNMNQ